MKVSVNWLREFVDFDLPPRELAYKLEMTGTAVESITDVRPGFTKVVTGVIDSMEPHPQADKLVVCRVDAGISQELTIVCGAENIKEGDKVPVALVGAELPGGKKISSAVLRGVESNGMLCSETELKLGEDTAGIMILDADTPVGLDLDQAIALTDTVIEFEITPNRPDCMSMMGIAREVAVITGGKVRLPEVKINESDTYVKTQAKVDIKDNDMCPRYSARVITDIKIGISPFWMRNRLLKAGIRPINNLVDITNYVLLETGQPLHAFDKNLVEDSTIIVRRAKKNEPITTLDGVERVLNESMLVIADATGPVALAGIMGGSTTEINGNTVDCLLESAYFEPTGIFQTSFTLDLRSEASARFERGVDYDGTVYAADRAAYLMQTLAGGKVLKGVIDEYPEKIEQVQIVFDPAKTSAVIGADIPAKQATAILMGLGMIVKTGPEGRLTVNVPSFRPDITREIDLVEEVVRVYGFEKIKSTMPDSKGSATVQTKEQRVIRMARDTLAAAGLHECINYSFNATSDISRLLLPEEDIRAKFVKVANPLSEAQSVMRTTLVPGLLTAARFNAGYGMENAQLFEIGRVFFDEKKGLPQEKNRVAGLLAGSWEDDAWYGQERPVDFYDLKGVVEALAARLHDADAEIVMSDDPLFHPGQRAALSVGGQKVGSFGLVHPYVIKNFGLAGDVYAFEFDAFLLAEHLRHDLKVKVPSRFPAMSRDISLLVTHETTVADITKAVYKAGGDLLAKAYPFDLYEGDQVPTGKKSLTYRLVYQAADRTLTVEETDAAHAEVLNVLQKDIKAEIR